MVDMLKSIYLNPAVLSQNNCTENEVLCCAVPELKQGNFEIFKNV